jgi:hypothetical protein
MKIVYFSADGVASMGRDGTGGTQLQGIDFVYDTIGYPGKTADKIVTVTNAPSEEFKDSEGNVYEDYNYYYESSCLLFFDNTVQYQNDYVDIYQEKIFVRRFYNTASGAASIQKTALNFSVEGVEQTNNQYIKFESYSDKCDVIIPVYYGEPRSSAS